MVLAAVNRIQIRKKITVQREKGRLGKGVQLSISQYFAVLQIILKALVEISS